MYSDALSYDTLFERLIQRKEKLALIGLGYVGMPIAIEFAKHLDVIGYNHNEYRIQQYKSGIDPTNEVGNDALLKTTVDFTSEEKRLREAKFLIVAVPTPVNTDHTPDLFPVETLLALLDVTSQKVQLSVTSLRFIPVSQKIYASQSSKKNLA